MSIPIIQFWNLRAARRLASAIAACLCLLLVSGSREVLAAEPWPELPLPPKSDAQWIAQSMRVNGVPMRVLQFQSRASRAEIVQYYSAYWSGGYEHKPSIHALGQATIVGQKHGPYLLTLKVEDAPKGAAVGLLSVAQVEGLTLERDSGELPLMGGAHVVSVVESDDPGMHSRQTMVLNPQSPALVAQFYQAALVNAGWRPVHSTDISSIAPGRTGSFLVFSQGGREMQLSIAPSQTGRTSTLLANLVTKDTGFDAR